MHHLKLCRHEESSWNFDGISYSWVITYSVCTQRRREKRHAAESSANFRKSSANCCSCGRGRGLRYPKQVSSRIIIWKSSELSCGNQIKNININKAQPKWNLVCYCQNRAHANEGGMAGCALRSIDWSVI